MNLYGKVFTELNYIISNMSESMQNKIPKDLRQSIEKKIDNEYKFSIDTSKTISQQRYSKVTRAIFSLIYSEYIASEDEKKKWGIFDRKYAELLNIKRKKAF